MNWPFFNVYVQRGFGSFGWYAIVFPHWVYVPIIGGDARRDRPRRRARCWIFRPMALARRGDRLDRGLPIVVVHRRGGRLLDARDAGPRDGGAGALRVHGDHAVAAIVIGGCLGLGRRRALPAAAGLVARLGMLLLAGQWLTLSTFYT